MSAITTSAYQQLWFDALDTIKDEIIAPNSAGSQIETRYIAPDGRNDEQWLGYLRDANGKVDIWLMTFSMVNGLSGEDDQKGAVGTFNKPVSVIIDYFADYRQGTDASNSETEFLKKLIAVDLELEKRKGCLKGQTMIRDWNFILKLRRFETATTHWATGILNIWFSEVFI